MNPEVSVLITTYNRSILLLGAIQSAARQTLRNIEIIVVDDGSTDDTALVVAGARAQDERIKYIPVAHMGRISVVSNVGLRYATGKYIAILDDDDEWIDKRKLERQIEFLETHGEYVACGSGMVVVDGRGNEISRVLKPEDDERIKKNALMANPMIHSASVFRRIVNREAVAYDEALTQFADWDFWLMMGLKGKLFNFQEYFVRYRMWERGSSFVRQRENGKSAVRIVRRHRDHYARYIPALMTAYAYLLYSYVPASLRNIFNPFLSKAKKQLSSL